MKQITMMSKRIFAIEDDEMEQIRMMLSKGELKGLIGLRSGEMININSIESIGEPEMEAYANGNKLNKDHTKVFIQGEWKWCDVNLYKIEYRPKVAENSGFKQLSE